MGPPDESDHRSSGDPEHWPRDRPTRSRQPGSRLVLGVTADNGAICRQKRLHVPGLICPGDPEGPEMIRPQARRPCRPWNMDALRKLYVFGDAEQRAGAEKAIDDIWAGRNE
jgi:hypothetical protein